MKSRKWLGSMVVGLALVGMVQGQDDGLLLFDGFKCDPPKTANSQVYVSINDQGITGRNMAAAEIIGFSKAAWSYPKMGVTNEAPVLPEYYTESGVYWNNGAMYRYEPAGNQSLGSSGKKWVYRDFSEEVRNRLPMEEKLYFRVILNFTKDGIFNTPVTDTHAIRGVNAFGAGFGTTFTGMGNYNQAEGAPKEDQASMLFLFTTTRATSSAPRSGDLVLRLSDADHYTNVDTNGVDYVLLQNVQPNVSYLCLAEVLPDAGENGKDRVRARAVALDEDFGKHLPTDADQFFAGCEKITDFDLVGPNDNEHIKHVILGGKNWTNPSWYGNSASPNAVCVFYDEFGIATKLKALCPMGDPSTMIFVR